MNGWLWGYTPVYDIRKKERKKEWVRNPVESINQVKRRVGKKEDRIPQGWILSHTSNTGIEYGQKCSKPVNKLYKLCTGQSSTLRSRRAPLGCTHTMSALTNTSHFLSETFETFSQVFDSSDTIQCTVFGLSFASWLMYFVTPRPICLCFLKAV